MNNKIHPRVKRILQRLSEEASFVTIADLAQKLNVSAKTIVRHLPEAEVLLKSYGLALNKKTGAGLGIAGDAESKRRMRAFLDTLVADRNYSPQERRIIMIGKLLQNQQPVKLYEFTSILNVTEGTISNDLDKLEDWFRRRRLAVVRKPGLGVYVEGAEQDIRKAIVHHIYENIDEEELLSVLYGELAEKESAENSTRAAGGYLMNLVDVAIIRKLENAVREVEAERRYNLADSAYVALVVHLALAVQRIQKNEKIDANPEFLSELMSSYEYQIAEKIAGKIAGAFEIVVPEGEVAYITMHLLGARNQYPKNGAAQRTPDNYHLVKLAKQMMKIAQAETGKPLANHQRLLVGLVNHLGPSISRLKMNLDIRNPLLEDMRTHYPELLTVAKKCADALERELNLQMPDAEIAFIAMHLGAAIEGMSAAARTYSVAIACPTGMGTSRMLATRIQKEYRNLNITELISAIRMDESQMKKLNIDFIISTVSIKNCAIPVVVVNSLLLPADKAKIDRQMLALAVKKELARSRETPPALPDFKARLRTMGNYGDSILHILESLFVAQDDASATVADLIDHAAKICAGDARGQAAIKNALAARQLLGGAAFARQRLLLLHCRSDAVKQLRFGVIQRKNYPIAYVSEADGQMMIQTALVALAPENSNRESIETIGYIAEALPERWGLVEILHKGDEETIYRELLHLYKTFYQEKIKLVLEE